MEEEVLPQRPNPRRRFRESQREALTYYPDNPTGAQLPADSLQAKERDDSPHREANDDQGLTTGDDGFVGGEAQPASPRGTGGEELPAYRSAAVGDYKFEYLDHTADVQLHAWGHDLTEAFENCALAMYNYMSPLQHVRKRGTRAFRAEGHDLQSLLFAFLDELLFVFATELFLAASVTIKTFDRTNFVIEAEGCGEEFDRSVNEVGTEIKAITYSAMSILERPGDAEVFVIVDI